MEADDKASLLAHLDGGRKALLDALSGVTEDLAGRVPAPGSWSVLECVEHVTVSEAYLLSQIASASESRNAVPNRQREALILSRGADRAKGLTAPDVAAPTGRFSTLQTAVEEFIAARERTVRFVENCEDDLRAKNTSHPLVGTVNCYEMLLMIAVHSLRHSRQIEEVMTSVRADT